MNFFPKTVASAALALLGAVAAQGAGNVWLTSYSQALKLSAQTGKPILADFTGTEWCIYCKKLDSEVFAKSEFKQWATKNVILLKLDYPETPPNLQVMKKQYPELLQRYQLMQKYPVQGFPTIYFLKSTGKAFGMFGYVPGGPTRWIALANRLVNPKAAQPRPMRISSGTSGYPDFKNKNLYADVDLRGKKAPKLVVEKWLSGKAPQTAGKVVLIDFWATWCPGCRDIIPELGAWQKKYGKDLVVIGVTDEESKKVLSFMKKTPMPYYVGTDRNQTTSKEIGIQSIPHALVITPDHVVRWQGFPDLREDLLTEEVLAGIIAASKRQTVASRQ